MGSVPEETYAQLQCMQKGGPLRLVHVPKPKLARDQVLIRQRVIAFNGLEWKQRDFGILVERWPHLLGIEGAGVIEAVGSEVENLKPGDEVTAWEAGRAHNEVWGGSYQELVVMPSYFVARKPKNITLEEAASLPICYNTAVQAILGLKIPLPFLPGTSSSGRAPTSILVLGGSSAVGANAIQLLRLAYPALSILTTSSTKHRAKVLSLGATKLIDYHSSTVVSDIKGASRDGKGVDMIIDCVGSGATQKDICEALDPAGSKMYAAVISGPEFTVPDTVTKLNISGWALLEVEGGKQIIPALTKLVEEGKYSVPLPVRVIGHGLEQVPELMDQIKTASGEKLVVTL